MKLIIDISEEIMEYIKNNGCLSVIYSDEVAKAIINGKPYEERPQGEWIKDGIGGIGSYRCSLCGRVICTSITNNKPYEDYPFCHCGADMRGKAE